jgi:hypothetical protein
MALHSFYSRLLVVSLIMASAGALGGRLYANDEATVMGNVAKLTGVARVSTDGKEWQALNLGDSLKPGCIVQTGEDNSTVDVELSARQASKDKSPPRLGTIRIFSGSAVRIINRDLKGTELAGHMDLGLDLLNGRQLLGVVPLDSEANVRLDCAGSTLELVIGKRTSSRDPETVFIFKAPRTLIVTSGEVSTRAAGRNSVLLRGCQSLNVSTGRVTDLSKDVEERKLWH